MKGRDRVEMETTPVVTKQNFADPFKSMVTANTVTNASLHTVSMNSEHYQGTRNTKQNFAELSTPKGFVLMVRAATSSTT